MYFQCKALASFFVGCARFFVPTIDVHNPESVGRTNCPPYFWSLLYRLLVVLI